MTGALILIVEDNEKNRKLLRDVLQLKGYRTVESDNGEEGIELALRLAPHLIVMDVRLPGIDGIEALFRLRAHADTRNIPVIAVTASVMERDKLKIRNAGFNGYLSKPISVKQFLEDVGNMLSQKTRGGRERDDSGEDPYR